MNIKLKNPSMDRLFQAVLSLKTIEECYSFFDDICTIHELQSFAQRLEVAFILNENKTYVEISDATGASTATISRVNRCLNYGADGYKMAIKRLNENNG